MPEITDAKEPYEILIRFRDGVVSGAHVQYIRKVTLGEEVLKVEELPAEPLGLVDFPTSDLMTQATEAALTAYNIIAAENEAVISENEVLMAEMKRRQDMTYPLLLQCYRSGQVSEAQWQQHLQDEVFAAWLKKHG